MNNYLQGRPRQDVGVSRKKNHLLSGLAQNSGFETGNQLAAEHFKQISPDDPHSPKVEVVLEEDRVTRIVITCTCGERIDLHCEF